MMKFIIGNEIRKKLEKHGIIIVIICNIIDIIVIIIIMDIIVIRYIIVIIKQ